VTKRKTVNEWIELSNSIHDSKYKYPFSEWGTFNSKSKLPISCPLHGVFHQSMSNHTHSKNPTGCPSCSGIKQLTLKERLEQAVKVHGDIYDYSQWPESLTAKTKVETTCTLCNHKWVHNVDNHIRGRGCPNCKSHNSILEKKALKEKLSLSKMRKCETLIDGCSDLQKSKYSYDKLPMPFLMKSVYEFECKEHGTFFTTPYNHFIKKSDCPNCVNSNLKNRHMFGFDKWLKFLKSIHNKYEFRQHESGSNTAKDKIYAICPLHGEWVVSIDSLKSSGCPACKGQSQNYLYINQVENGCLKFGIACDPERRLKGQNRVNNLQMERLMVFIFPNYSDCRNCESEIKKSVTPVLSKKDLCDGWTETCSSKYLSLIISMCKGFGGKFYE